MQRPNSLIHIWPKRLITPQYTHASDFAAHGGRACIADVQCSRGVFDEWGWACVQCGYDVVCVVGPIEDAAVRWEWLVSKGIRVDREEFNGGT
jgi:hypothetical protein